MTNTSKIITAIVIVAVILIGVGYAAIERITLEIEGSLAATATQGNFTVKFTNASPAEGNVVAKVTDDLSGTLNVSGLTAKGETATATFTIQNTSGDLSANLAATSTNENTEYFKVSTSLSAPSIAKTETATLTVTVELIKTPIDANETDTVGISVTATPVQPQ